MRLTAALATRLGASASLASLYLALLALWLESPGLYPQSWLEYLVLSSFVVRCLALFGIGRLRRMPAANAVVLFGIDVFVVILAAASLEITGYQSFASFGKDYTFAWFGSALLTYPLPAIYFSVRELGDRGRLAAQLPACAAIFALLDAAFSNLTQGASSGGLSALTTEFLRSIRGQGFPLVGGEGILIAGGILFASLLATEASRTNMKSGAGLAAKLVLVLVGPLVMSALILALNSLGPWALFGGPVLAASIVMAVVSRGK